MIHASILVSNLRRGQILPIAMRGRQYDERHIGMSAEEGEQNNGQQ
jgi:hypothetical protein